MPSARDGSSGGRPVEETRPRPVAACTIASHNYLALAQVLATSYVEHHPGAEVYVCLVDRRDPEVEYEALPFTCLFADELGIPSFRNFAFRYDILELNTAVKPFLLGVLRDRFGHDRAFYFDPDIWILDQLDTLASRLLEHPMVLTPHVTRPLDDDHDPAERKLLQVGVYNLGFLGLRLDDSTRDFLSWWQDRLHRFCLADPPHGLFVDQQWASFAPAFVGDVCIERDPIYNVAYWNLPHRRPEPEDGVWRVDGRPVGFFHFSGVRFDDLRTVSKHQDRLAPGSRPELRPLFEAYRDEVRAAGQEHWRTHRYSYGHFLDADGSELAPIPAVARQVLQRVDPRGRRWADPFDAAGDDSFLAWLTEPLDVPVGRVNRAALALWESRDDLLFTFPDLQHLDLHGYLDWIEEEVEAGRPPLPEIFLRGLRSRLPRRVARHLAGSPDAEARRVVRVHRSDDAVVRALDVRRAGNLTHWLNDPVPGRRAEKPLVTRLMMLLFEMREDLRRDFSEPLGDDQRSFAYWFCREGAAEFDIAEDFVAPVRRSLAWRSRLGLLRQRLLRQRLLWQRLLWQRLLGKQPLGGGERQDDGATRAGEDGRETPHDSAPVPGPDFEPDSESDSESALEPTREASATLDVHGAQIVGFFSQDASLEEGSSFFAEALTEALGEDPRSQTGRVVRLALDRNAWGQSSGGRIHPPDGAPYDLTVLHVPPHRTAEALSVLPVAARAGGRIVAWWWWDLAHLHLGAASEIGRLDEIWVPGEFVRRAVDSLADVPVRIVPPVVPEPSAESADPSLHGLGERDVIFYSSFDAADIAERANPFALLDLWRNLGDVENGSGLGGRRPGLSLRIDRAGRAPELVEALRRQARDTQSESGLPVVVHDEPSVPEAALLASCDAWICLDRGSATGLRSARAARLAKPLVITAYGGVTDFLDESTSFPVDFRLRRLARHEGPFPAGAVWAEPDLDHAREQVRAVLSDADEASRRGVAARRRMEERALRRQRLLGEWLGHGGDEGGG